MSSSEQVVFEKVAADTLNRFGYMTNHSQGGLGYSQMIRYRLHEIVVRSKQLFIENVIDTIRIKYFGKPPFAD